MKFAKRVELKCSHPPTPHQKGEVINVLINSRGGISLSYIFIANHHIVHFKYLTIFVNYISRKAKKRWGRLTHPCWHCWFEDEGAAWKWMQVALAANSSCWLTSKRETKLSLFQLQRTDLTNNPNEFESRFSPECTCKPFQEHGIPLGLPAYQSTEIVR